MKSLNDIIWNPNIEESSGNSTINAMEKTCIVLGCGKPPEEGEPGGTPGGPDIIRICNAN